MISMAQVEIMRHAVGFGTNKVGYRNRYVSDLTDDIQQLIDLGLMSGPFFNGEFGPSNSMFCVTETGKNLMGIGKLQKLEKTVTAMTWMRDSYREFWLSKNTMHSWERESQINEDDKYLEEALK